MKTDVAVAITTIKSVEKDVADVKTDVADVKTDIADFNTNMVVASTRIEKVETDIAALVNEVQQGFKELNGASLHAEESHVQAFAKHQADVNEQILNAKKIQNKLHSRLSRRVKRLEVQDIAEK